MSDVTIRFAKAEDLPVCAAIINEWIDDTDWMPRIHPRETIAGFFSEDILRTRHFLVAQKAGEILGYLSMDKQKHIHGFYLAKTARGSGVGTLLLNRAKAIFPDKLKLFAFENNTGARAFYEREGFKEIRRTQGDNVENLPDVFYRWQPDEGAA